MPDISVLLPALNAEDTIGPAITSTLRALPADGNVVVLDDGSTDSTSDVALAAARRIGQEKRLRLLRNETPQGVASGLNQLLQETDSRLVARMDADDVTLPGRFTSCLRAIEAGDDLVFMEVLRRRGPLLRPTAPLGISADAFPVSLLLINPVTHGTLLARREAIDSVGGYRQVPAEDYDLWLRAASAGLTQRCLPRWGLIYRSHAGQVTARPGWFDSSRRDPQVAESYTTLALAVTGHALMRPALMAALPPEERRAQCALWVRACEEASAHLPTLARVRVRRRIRERMRWVEANASTGSGNRNADENTRRD